MGNEEGTKTIWRRVLSSEELAEGRVKPVTCGHRTLCMTHIDGRGSSPRPSS